MEHHHHHHQIQSKDINRAFLIGILLNLLYTIFEFGTGFIYNSLALLSDAGHNLSDVGSLLLSLLGFKLAKMVSNSKFTYGYKKATIIASLMNAILLIFVVIEIMKEAIDRFYNPSSTQGISIITVAGIGIIINTISAFLFIKGKDKDLNIKGAFLHLIVDALVSVGVVISGIIIYYTNWYIIDPIISIIIAIIIIISTWELLVESIRLTVDGVPKNINTDEIKDLILSEKGVSEIHHLHIWAISTSTNALTAHVVFKKGFNLNESQPIKEKIKHKLSHANIQHITLEFESFDENCHAIECK